MRRLDCICFFFQSIGPSYQPADDAEDEEENGWNGSPDPPTVADLDGCEETAMVLSDDPGGKQEPLSLHSTRRYPEATIGPSYNPGGSQETSVAKSYYFRGAEEQRFTHGKLSPKSLPVYSYNSGKSQGASAVKDKFGQTKETTTVRSFDWETSQETSIFKSYNSEKPQKSPLVKSCDSGLARDLLMPRSSTSAKPRRLSLGYGTLSTPSTTPDWDVEGTYEAPPASPKIFQEVKFSPHRKGKSQSLPVRQQEAPSQNPRDNHSMDMIFHSSADHSIGNEDTLLHSIDMSHLEETHSLAAREEHSLTQPHSLRPSLIPTQRMEPDRSTASAVSLEDFRTASFTDRG